MPNTALHELIDERTMLMPLRVKQYHEMIASGVLLEGEPYELLRGLLVRKDRSAAGEDPMTVGHDHASSVTRLMGLDGKLERLGCHLRIQQPITLPPHDEPEPDAVIVAGVVGDYDGRHPGAEDVECVIEVADASLRRDRTVKQRIYADSGIPRYIIINLPDRLVEVYTQPLLAKGRYGHSLTLHPGQKVVSPAGGGRQLLVPVRRLFP